MYKQFILLKLLVSISIALAGFAWAAGSQLKQVKGAADLQEVKGANFSQTYVKPGVDFSFYNKIFVGEALFSYRDIKSPGTNGKGQSGSTSRYEYPIKEEDRKLFEKIVRDAFRTEIVKGNNYKLVDNINTDERTLVLRALLVDIVSKVPPKSAEWNKLYLPSVGEATLGLEFLDRPTNEVLARVIERGVIGGVANQSNGISRPVNRETVIEDVRLWATNAAIKLRNTLDSALKD